MLYYNNLEKTITDQCFRRGANELDIISGYIGPAPIEELENRIYVKQKRLDYKLSIIYGMYGDSGISKVLHKQIIPLRKPGLVDILYSTTPIHSKIYIWKENGDIVSALIGSANFSVSGIRTPFKETLAETSEDTYVKIQEYLDLVRSHCIDCSDPSILTSTTGKPVTTLEDLPIISIDPTLDKSQMYEISLLDPIKDEVPASSGLNWGRAVLNGSHVSIDDAYIPIRREDIDKAPFLFPKKRAIPLELTKEGHSARDNDPIEIIWDDGTRMQALLEGSQNLSGVKYPKQISSLPSKKLFGEYIRKRLGLSSGTRITKEILENYGRTTIGIALVGEGIYYFDFSVKEVVEKKKVDIFANLN
jgi:hypothetical protein